MAAVPSKHDLASFVRSIHVELALAVPVGSVTLGGARGATSEAEAGGGGSGVEADLSLAPFLLKGMVQAVKLLCTKVEAMRSVEEVSTRYTSVLCLFFVTCGKGERCHVLRFKSVGRTGEKRSRALSGRCIFYDFEKLNALRGKREQITPASCTSIPHMPSPALTAVLSYLNTRGLVCV